MIKMRTNPAILFIVTVAASISIFAEEQPQPPAKSKRIDFSSPQSVFIGYADAASHADAATLFETTSPGMRNRIIFEVFFQQGMIENKELQKTIDKYFDEKKFEAHLKTLDLTEEPTPQETAARLASFVSEPKKFVVETHAIFEKLQPSGYTVANLRKVIVKGDYASGIASQTNIHVGYTKIGGVSVRAEKELKTNIEVLFMKIKGRWKVAAPWELDDVKWADESPIKLPEVKIDYSSPQSVFNGYEKAVSQGDGLNYFAAHSTEMQNKIVVDVIMSGSLQKAELNRALRKYCNLQKLHEIEPALDLSAERAAEIVDQCVSDKTRLMAEAYPIMLEHTTEKVEYRKLRNLVLKGDSATGRCTAILTQYEMDYEIPMEVRFRKQLAKWRIDEMRRAD